MTGTSIPTTPPALQGAHKPVDAGSVPMANHKKTLQLSLLMAEKAKIALDSKNPIPKSKLMKDALSKSGLMTLVSGERPPPIVTSGNSTGYKAKSAVMILSNIMENQFQL